MKDDPISVWISDGIAWIKPSGDACHLNAPKVSTFARETIGDGKCNFAVDLGECSSMDANFMGTLAGIALAVREMGRGKVQVVAVKEDLEKQLRHLGLDSLFGI